MTGLDWRAALAADDGIELQPAASLANLEQVEAHLGANFPADLLALYQISNGLFDKPGQWFVIWPLDDLVARNRKAWADENADRQRLFGFGDDGTGAAFCVPRHGAAGVFVWNPIDGQAYRLADTIEQFWFGWSKGMLTT